MSPRRRGAGLVLLALLAAMAYGSWYFTNDRRVRLQAESYLQELTGGQVKIDKAHFSLFRGIELQGVRLRVPGDDSQDPFFQAKTVVVRYRPWDLFVNRRLLATRIMCLEPTVNLEYDEQHQPNYTRLFPAQQEDRPRPYWSGDLVPIYVSRAKVRVYDRTGGRRRFTGQKDLSVTFAPSAESTYVVTLEEDRGGGQVAIEGSIALNLATGQYDIKGKTILEGLDEVLPTKYRRWREQYRITGPVFVRARSEPSPDSGIFDADLVDVALRLPDEQGGLDLKGVRGKLVFDPNGVSLENVSGRIVQGGDANFVLWGRYDGYTPTAGFDVHMKVDRMTLPEANSASGPIREMLKVFRDEYRPSGPISVDVHFRRPADGTTTHYEGTAAPEGLSVTYKWFPYRLDDLRGTIAFEPNRVELRGLVARHGAARIGIRGVLSSPVGRMAMDLHFDANDMAFDQDLEKSLPPNFANVFRTLSPAGTAMGTVHLFRPRPEDVERAEVTIRLDGRASMSFAGFPYRLEKLTGELYVANDTAEIRSVRGSRGQMNCTIDGTITNVSSDKNDVKLTITAHRVPVDEALMNALGPDTRMILKSVNPSGVAEDVTAVLRQKAGGKLDYTIQAVLGGAGFKAEGFPYAVTDANGLLTITPEVITIQDLRGRHGKTPVTIRSGKVYVGKGIGLDLDLAAADLRLDQELLDALPPGVRRVWQRLKPSGQADATLSFEQDSPALPGKTNYVLTLTAKDIQALCRDFPIPLSGVQGRAIARPGWVRLDHLSAGDGKMRVLVDGNIVYDERSERAALSIRAENVPISAEFLAAMPGELASLAGRFQAGGTCDANIGELRFVRAEGPAATTPASGSTTASTSPGGGASIAWDAEGSICLRDAVMDMGFGNRTLTGSVKGVAMRSAEGLTLDADIDLESILVGRQKVSAVRGKLLKTARSSVVHIDDFQAKAYGGRMTGVGRIDLGDPMKYGLRLSVEDMSVQGLVKDSLSDPNAKVDMEGLLSGTIQFTGTAGRPAERQAAGRLQIYKGKLYKLPVILGLLQIVTLSLPGDSAFTEGELTYHLHGDNLTFQEIYLRGPAMSIVGSGKMDLKGETLNLNFLGGPPNKLPRLSGLDELVEGIAREMMEIQVTGTLSKPQMRTVPLRALDELVRKLLIPSRQKD